jgi:hypothetical protein
LADDSADTPAPPPFVVAWAVDDDYRLPDDFFVPRDKGLVEVQVLRDPEDGPSVVLTRWASRDHLAVHRRWLAHRLGLEDPPRVRGAVGEVRRPPRPWLKRLPIYGLAMGLLGFFGTLELVQARYGLFFGAPDVAVQVEGGAMVETVAGSPVRFELSAVNHSRVTTANVGDLEVRVRPSGTDGAGPLAETWPPARLGPIDPGGRESAGVEVEADLEPGLYRLELDYDVKGGVLLPSVRRRLSAPARVWPFLHAGRPYPDSSAAAQTPSLHVWVHLPVQVGPQLSAGVECLVELTGEPGLTFTGVTSRDLGIDVVDRGRVGSGDAETTFIQWRTPSLGPTEELSFLLGLSSERPRADWTGAVDRIDTHCEPRGATS